MDARIAPRVQFAHLASGYRPNLRLRESITTRRRKVIAMYTAKVRIVPIQGDLPAAFMRPRLIRTSLYRVQAVCFRSTPSDIRRYLTSAFPGFVLRRT